MRFKYLIFIIVSISFLLIFYFTSLKSSKGSMPESANSEILFPQKIVKTNNSTKQKKIEFNNAITVEVEQGEIYTDIYCRVKKYKNKLIFINGIQASVSVLDLSNFNKNDFEIKGNGYKYCSKIDAFEIINNELWLYDTASRKILKYSLDGKFVSEEHNTIANWPYSITSAIENENNLICTGISYRGWSQFTQGKAYNNVFILDPINKSLLKKYSIFEDLSDSYLKDDVLYHPQINMQEIKKYKTEFYLFDIYSGSLFKLKFKNNLVLGEKVSLDKDLFKRHTPLKFKDYLKLDEKSLDEWFNMGSRLIDILINDKYLLCYVSEFNNKINEDDNKLIIINKDNYEVELILEFNDSKAPINVNNEELIFLGYGNKGANEDKLLLYKLYFKELF